MISDDTDIDNMKNQCENPAEIPSCLVTIYVQKVIIFVLVAMWLPIPPYVAFWYYLCMTQNAKQRSNPHQNRMLHQDAPGAHLQLQIFDSAVVGFLFAYEESMKYARRKKSWIRISISDDL